jgi:hypothetical protein
MDPPCTRMMNISINRPCLRRSQQPPIMHPSGALHLLEYDEHKYYTSRTNSNTSIGMKCKQGSKYVHTLQRVTDSNVSFYKGTHPNRAKMSSYT